MASMSWKLINWRRQIQILPKWKWIWFPPAPIRPSSPFSSSVELFKCSSSSSSPIDTYFQEISKLGMDGKVDEMGNLSCKMVQQKQTFSFPEEFFFYALIDYFVIKGKFKAALHLLHSIWDNASVNVIQSTSTTTTAYHVMRLNYFLQYLCDRDRIDLALHQFKRMDHKDSSSPPNTRTFEIIMYALCRNKMVDECNMLLDHLFQHLNHNNTTSPPPGPDFYAIVLPSFVKANEPYRVSQLLTMMKDSDIHPLDVDESSESVGSFLSLYYDTISAFCYLWRFEDAAQFVEDHPYYESSHAILLAAYCNAGRFDEAIAFLDKMVHKGADISYWNWRLLVTRLCGEHEIGKAFGCLKRMITFWDQRHISHNHPTCINQTPTLDTLVPHSKTCPTLSNMITSSIHNTYRTDDGVLDLAVYIMLISGVWKEGHKCGRNGGKQVDVLPDVSCRGAYEQVLGVAHYNAARLENSSGLLEKMIKESVLDFDSYSIQIRGFCVEGKIDKAFGTLKTMINLLYQELMSACDNQISTNDGLVPNSETCPSLLDMTMSSLHENNYKGDDGVLRLGVYIMLISGVWREGH